MRLLRLSVAALAVIVACSRPDAPVVAPIFVSVCIGPLTVSPSVATLRPGDSLQAAATVPSCFGSDRVWWRSSDTSVAAVDSAKGLIRARALGVVTITGLSVFDPAEKGAMAVQVVP